MISTAVKSCLNTNTCFLAYIFWKLWVSYQKRILFKLWGVTNISAKIQDGFLLKCFYMTYRNSFFIAIHSPSLYNVVSGRCLLHWSMKNIQIIQEKFTLCKSWCAVCNTQESSGLSYTQTTGTKPSLTYIALAQRGWEDAFCTVTSLQMKRYCCENTS